MFGVAIGIAVMLLGCMGSTRSESGRLALESPGASRRDVVAIGAEHIRPAFTRETVILLNGIVARSLDTIRDYDQTVGEMRQLALAAESPADDTATGTGIEAIVPLTEFDRLAVRAESSAADMKVEVAALEAGAEPYNEAILAGMVDFVETVATEIRETQRRLADSGTPRDD